LWIGGPEYEILKHTEHGERYSGGKVLFLSTPVLSAMHSAYSSGFTETGQTKKATQNAASNYS